MENNGKELREARLISEIIIQAKFIAVTSRSLGNETKGNNGNCECKAPSFHTRRVLNLYVIVIHTIARFMVLVYTNIHCVQYLCKCVC